MYGLADIVDMYSANTKARKELGWNYDMDFLEVTNLIMDEEILNFSIINLVYIEACLGVVLLNLIP